MSKRTIAKPAVVKTARARKSSKAENQWENTSPGAGEPGVATVWGKPEGKSAKAFKVSYGGKQKQYAIKSGFGYFIPSLRKAESLTQVNEVVESGITSGEVEDIVQFLDLKVPEIAKAASVSASTVSRWRPETPIGVPGSNQFFRIDELIRKGAELFGGAEQFKQWLNNPNMALGNAVPARLLTSHIGVELVDEALDALHYGNVM
jgi:putative toxin-antitoxin system antitoxin component (TIGR02293 family)